VTALRVQLPPKMRPFAERKARHKIARGGRGSGKSWSIARILIARAVATKTRVLCCREVQKSIKESSLRLLADQIAAMGLSHLFDVQKTCINGPHGSEFVFVGLQDHTADSVKSFEGFDIAWVEEAHKITANSANILIPTIRNAGSEIWWSYNPDQASDFVHQLAEQPDPNTLVVDINWRDNPWFPVELDLERRKLKAINDDLYEHIWEGKCRSAAGLLFKRRWFKRYDLGHHPTPVRIYGASDYAVTDEQDAEGREPDYTEHGAFGLDEKGDLWVLDWESGQVDTHVGLTKWLDLCRRRKPIQWFDEAGVIHRAITPARNKLQQERNQFVHVETLPTAGSKAERALGFAARAAAGTVHIPNTPWGDRLVDQLCAFNGEDGRVDDMVDVCSLIARGLDSMVNAQPQTKPERPKPPEPFTEDWLMARERAEAKSEQEKARYYR
jgi:phage terminase large subunit-like protein